MPGPPPKPPELRQRRNGKPTAGLLPSRAEARKFKVPPLPNRGRGRAWHERTKAWWAAVWTSPIAVKYEKFHHDGLLDLAELIDMRNRLAPDDSQRLKVSAEIRAQRPRYWLDPADLARMGWVIPADDEAPTSKPEPAAPVEEDPRAALRVVS